MGKSQRVKNADVRDVCRLVGECREVGVDPRAWRTHLLEGARRLTRAQLGVGGLESWPGDGPQAPRDPTAVGWTSEKSAREFASFVQNVNYREEVDLLAKGMVRLQGTAPLIVRSRPQMFDDRPWYMSSYFNEIRRPWDMDDCLLSIVELPNNAVDLITVHRVLKDRIFGQRERSMLAILHEELRPLLGTSLRVSGASMYDLSPRLREVLAALLKGDSEKEVARALGLTPATTHQYVKRIYRHFNVSSRGELMATYIRVPDARKNGRPA